MKPTREEIAAIIKEQEEQKSQLQEAFNEFADSLTEFRNAWLKENPDKGEKEFNELFNAFLNDPNSPLKQIQLANSFSHIPKQSS